VSVQLVPVEGIAEVASGDDLAGIVGDALAPHGPVDGDVIVVTQKIVSKAEGRVVPDEGEGRATWIERETRRIVARRGDLVVTETRHGFVCANAGVDASNVAAGWLSLLPEDPDASAERLRAALTARFGVRLAIVVTDTFGRPWREGLVNVAIGCAGIPAVVDLRGSRDHHGRTLEATIVAIADEIAAASGLVIAKASRVPVALVRGFEPPQGVAPSPAASLVRRPEDDLFREAPLWLLASARPDAPEPVEVPRVALEEAFAAAGVAVRDASLVFVVATSEAARGRVLAAIDDDRAARARVLVVPIVGAPPDDAALLAAGGAIERFGLAIHAQALAWSWSPAPAGRDPLRAAVGAEDGWTPLGVIAVGGTRTGAAAPRPPLDLSALVRFEERSP
jgi:coenzyme F420-0:L-glutamate ligase/coenzyme F420-1:gamma-L-glutamate ligase